MSDWLEKNFASHVFGSGTLSKPSVLAFALCSDVPAEDDTGATIPELPDANGYTRKALNPSSDNWLDPVGADGECINHQEILFEQASADWGWVSGVAIVDSATHGAGNVWFRGAVTVPKNVGVYDRFSFPSGLLSVTFS